MEYISILFLLFIQILIDTYLEKSFTSKLVFCITSCAIFLASKILKLDLSMVVILMILLDMSLDDIKTQEVYWLNFLELSLIALMISYRKGIDISSALIPAIICIITIFTHQKYIGLIDCLIVFNLSIIMNLEQFISFVFYMGIFSGIFAFFYLVFKRKGGKLSFVPIIFSSFLIYTVIPSVFEVI